MAPELLSLVRCRGEAFFQTADLEGLHGAVYVYELLHFLTSLFKLWRGGSKTSCDPAGACRCICRMLEAILDRLDALVQILGVLFEDFALDAFAAACRALSCDKLARSRAFSSQLAARARISSSSFISS